MDTSIKNSTYIYYALYNIIYVFMILGENAKKKV